MPALALAEREGTVLVLVVGAGTGVPEVTADVVVVVGACVFEAVVEAVDEEEIAVVALELKSCDSWFPSTMYTPSPAAQQSRFWFA